MNDHLKVQNISQTEDIQDKAKTFGIASLILGIIGLIGSLTGNLALVGVICAIIGLVLGSKARKILPLEQRGIATAGWICSIIALCLSFLGIIVLGGILGLLGIAALLPL